MTPKKYPQNLHTPKKIFIFLKTQKNIEIQNFEPKKMGRAYVCVKISEYPPWGVAKVHRVKVGMQNMKHFFCPSIYFFSI